MGQKLKDIAVRIFLLSRGANEYSARPVATTLYDLIPRDEKISNDLLLTRFLEYAEARRLQLYPAQESAILELFEEKNVILNTPTGSGTYKLSACPWRWPESAAPSPRAISPNQWVC